MFHKQNTILIRSHRLRFSFQKGSFVPQPELYSTNNSSFGSPEKYVTSNELEKQKLKREKSIVPDP
jgi:hypothetical protein